MSVGRKAIGSILHNLHYNLRLWFFKRGRSRQYYNANYVTYRGKGSGENTEAFEVRENWIFGAWKLSYLVSLPR